MKKAYNSIISLNHLMLKVNLGVTEEERKIPQDVKLDFKIYLKDAPKACESDDINDTICYHEVTKIVEKFCHNQEFKLLEYMCFNLHKKIKKIFNKNVRLWIRVEKCKPPIDNLLGTTSFEYSDL